MKRYGTSLTTPVVVPITLIRGRLGFYGEG
jgi:hypothetical protein